MANKVIKNTGFIFIWYNGSVVGQARFMRLSHTNDQLY